MARRSKGYRYASESTLNQQINARRDAYAARNQTFNNNFYLFKMRGSRQQSLTDIADKLARSIQEQWAREVRVQTLNDHAPLRVSWGPADDALADSWDSLARLAAEGAGGTGGLPQDSWAAGPADLAGSGPELPATLAKVPTGRLVVLGEGGTGKTMLMTRLAVDLIKQRKTGSGPVPVVLPLASWDPASQNLADRMTELLVRDHQDLSDPAPPGEGNSSQARALLDAGLIVPLLDGLDELPDALLVTAIGRVNEWLGTRLGQPLVLTCRTTQYRAAVTPASGLGLVVRGAAVVELRSLTSSMVGDYLKDGAPTHAAAARWQPVLDALGTDAPVSQALRTPLMAGLAHVIYNPRPAEAPDTVPDPAQLCDPSFQDPQDIRDHLLDAFIPAAYRGASRWPGPQAAGWLLGMAALLNNSGIVDVAWWDFFRWSVTDRQRAVMAGLLGTAISLPVAAGVAFVPASPLRGLYIACTIVFCGGPFIASLAWRPRHSPPARGFTLSPIGVTMGILSSVATGVALRFLPAFHVHFSGITLNVLTGSRAPLSLLADTAAFATCLFFQLGFELRPANLEKAASPQLVRDHDRAAALRLILGVPLVLLLAGVFGLRLTSITLPAAGPHHRPAVYSATFLQLFHSPLVLVAVIFFGLLLGARYSMHHGVWLTAALSVLWKAALDRLPAPWAVMAFLEDAHQRGVLRQHGAVYQFRHAELQNRLAARHSYLTSAALGRVS